MCFFKYQMEYSCIFSDKLSPLEQRFRASQIIFITNFVIISSVGIKRVDCMLFSLYLSRFNFRIVGTTKEKVVNIILILFDRFWNGSNISIRRWFHQK